MLGQAVEETRAAQWQAVLLTVREWRVRKPSENAEMTAFLAQVVEGTRVAQYQAEA